MNLSPFFHKYRIYDTGSKYCPYNVEARRGRFPFYYWSFMDCFNTVEGAEKYIQKEKERIAKIGVVKYV